MYDDIVFVCEREREKLKRKREPEKEKGHLQVDILETITGFSTAI